MIRVTGWEDIDKVLKGLPLQVNDRILQAANAAAAKPLVAREKALAPEGPTGNLVDSIGVQKGSAGTLRSGSRELGAIVVGPRRGKYKGFAAHLVEYGTVDRELKGTGKYKAGTNRGKITGKPFAQPAWEQTKTLVEKSINDELGKKLYSFMKRTIKNG